MSFLNLKNLESREMMPGFYGRFIHGDSSTIVHRKIETNATLPEHSHPHEQVSNLLDGEFEMTINGRTKRLQEGAVAIIPPYAVHSDWTMTNCHFIDVFHSVREDYR